MVTRRLPVLSDRIRAILADLGHPMIEEASVAGKAGSGRMYFRIGVWPESVILLNSNPEDADYERFLSVSVCLRNAGLRVPAVYGADDASRQVVLEDLGHHTLLHRIEAPSASVDRVISDYRAVLGALHQWQERTSEIRSDCPCLCDRSLDESAHRWEWGYFLRRCVEEVWGVKENRLTDPHLIEELGGLSSKVALHPRVVVHRDFQSQNLMWHRGEPWFIDYQGAREGSVQYDVASLLWDPYARLSEDLRETLIEEWLSSNVQHAGPETRRQLEEAAIQRVMQALGAYGFLSVHKGLPWFARQIDPGRDILRGLVRRHGGMPALLELLESAPEA